MTFIPKLDILPNEQLEAVKTLACFEGDDARNVDATTREYLSRTAADWHCAVSTIAKTEDRRLGP